jgi:PAS domain S-box-containing protein
LHYEKTSRIFRLSRATPLGRSLVWHLGFFAAVIALPIVGLVAYLLLDSATAERARLVAGAHAVALGLARDIDRELAGMARTTEALATSPSLREGDLAAFSGQARTLVGLQGNNIVLRDRDGQQLLNANMPWGSPLPRSNEAVRDLDRRALLSRIPQISGLVLGAVRRVPVFIVDVPIFGANGEVAYFLDMSLETARLASLLEAQSMPAGWWATVFDQSGMGLVATAPEAIGESAKLALSEAIARGDNELEFVSRDEVRNLATFSKVNLSGWTVAIGVPSEILLRPLWRSQINVGALVLLALVLSSTAAVGFGRRIARPTLRLAGAAAALSKGQPTALEGTGAVREIALVGRALEAAEIELARHAAERERTNEELRHLNATLEQRVAERTRQLAAGEERVRAIFDSMSQFVALLTPEGILLKVNRSALEFAGLERDAVVDWPFWEARWWSVDKASQERLRDAIRQAAQGRLVRYEAEIGGAGDRRAIIDFSLKSIRDASGRVAFLLAEGYDVTERIEAERRLAESEAMLLQAQKLEAVGQLTGGIAHDFNNLLAAVIGNLELLAVRMTGDDKAMTLVSRANQAAERGAKLTSQLLAFSRKQHLEAKRTNISELVGGMGDLLLRTIGGTVRIEHRLAADPWPVIGDPNQIELAILNLALNARDAMPLGGSLTIETANIAAGTPESPRTLPACDYVMVAVADTGTGMTETVMAKAFDPFFTTKEVGKGSGLGLSMVLGLAQQHGGGVEIDSRLGSGTIVRLYVPRAAHEAKPPAPEGDRPRPGPRHNPARHVLVVDDEADVRELVGECLAAMGHQVSLAPSGPAALDILERETIDLAIVDVAMPEMSGPAFVSAARSRCPELCAMFMTGYADLTILHDLGGAAILKKPFRISELHARIAEALGLTACP